MPLLMRLLRWVGIIILGFATILGVEIGLALRREYLPTDQPLDLNARFGSGKGAPLRFVVLGDSTSVGLGVDDPADAYPTLLARRVADETARPVELTVLGVSGARVADVLSDQVPAALALEPDLVFVGIGANDVTHLTTLGEIRRDMEAVVEVLTGTGATVVVAGAPDMRVYAWPQPLRQLSYLRGKQVTGVIEHVARTAGVPVVELAKLTGPLFAADPARHFSEDRFHPSALGYRRWADAIYPVVAGALP